MGMNQQEKQALTDNWEEAKTQIQSRFPGVTEAELQQGESDPSSLAQAIADRTGQDKAQVEQQLQSVAKQFSA